MSDSISRQMAIDEIKKHYRAHDNDLLELIAFNIGRLPSAQQWIPCSERLPDEDYYAWIGASYSDDVIMSVCSVEDEETIIDYGHTVDGEWYSDTANCFVSPVWRVLAWMPGPEPYREGK